MTSLLKIRLTRPWGSSNLQVDDALFSTELPLEQADALLCDWRPLAELLAFRGPRAWFCCEPATNPRHGRMVHKDWRAIYQRLAPHEILFHAHADPRYRLPHITHWGTPTFRHNERRSGIVCVASNTGGPPAQRWPAIVERNRFATAARVSLYGKRSRWLFYRDTTFQLPHPPGTFVGELPGNWGSDEKLDLMARHHAAICLENTQEPWYFTEKFVDCVIAGCVPIYRAHSTVRDSVLQGAVWIDPADHHDDIDETLEAALSLDQRATAEANHHWLQSPPAHATHGLSVYQRIADVLRANPR